LISKMINDKRICLVSSWKRVETVVKVALNELEWESSDCF
jgi:hypothetical protein